MLRVSSSTWHLTRAVSPLALGIGRGVLCSVHGSASHECSIGLRSGSVWRPGLKRGLFLMFLLSISESEWGGCLLIGLMHWWAIAHLMIWRKKKCSKTRGCPSSGKKKCKGALWIYSPPASQKSKIQSFQQTTGLLQDHHFYSLHLLVVLMWLKGLYFHLKLLL